MIAGPGPEGSAAHERGAVLVVSLLLLVVLTLLGVTAMQGTAVETRMAANRQDRATAFEAAEAALRQGEAAVTAMTSPPTAVGATCATGCDVWQLGALFPDFDAYLDPANWADPRIPVVDTSVVTLQEVARPPKYVIELIDTGRSGGSLRVDAHGRTYHFLVTAWAVGESTASQVVLQSSMARYYPQ